MAGAPASISFVTTPLQGYPQPSILAAINTAFSGPLMAKVVDANGNPVSGVTVTFVPQGRDGSIIFAGGVNTAVTDANGVAQSAAITANGSAGFYQVWAWVGPVGPGAIGPAIISLSNYNPGPNTPSIWPQISAAWVTAKAQLATVQADANTLATDLAALEATCDTLYSLGAGDVSEWLRQNARQARLGFQPRVSAGGNIAPQLLSIWAAQPGARDLSNVDQRPITLTSTGRVVGLS